MKKLTIYSIILVGVSLLLTVAILPSATSAQGRYTSKYSNQDVGNIIATLEQSSGKFKNDFDTAMDRSSLNGTSTEDRFNAIVKDYDNSLNRLRRNYSGNNAWWGNRNDVQDVMNKAQPVNNMMTSLPFARNLERQWNKMRNDINKLADTFDMPGIAGGGWTGGPWNPGNPGNPGGPGWGGGQTSTPPSWAQGTFYSTNGSNISMTIGSTGRVTVVNGGQTYYGTYYRNNITVNGDSSTLSRNGNSIRTYNRSTGQTTDYSRNGWGGGVGPGYPGGPGVGNGNTTIPPSWAQGTFYATNNGSISLTINSNGQVSVVNGGQSYYGTYYNGSIILNGDSSTVTKTRNGIRTYNQNQGVTTDYRRR